MQGTPMSNPECRPVGHELDMVNWCKIVTWISEDAHGGTGGKEILKIISINCRYR